MIDRREVIEPTEAERELDAATRRSEVSLAASRLMPHQSRATTARAEGAYSPGVR
jgi:hypothetical protein